MNIQTHTKAHKLSTCVLFQFDELFTISKTHSNLQVDRKHAVCVLLVSVSDYNLMTAIKSVFLFTLWIDLWTGLLYTVQTKPRLASEWICMCVCTLCILLHYHSSYSFRHHVLVCVCHISVLTACVCAWTHSCRACAHKLMPAEVTLCCHFATWATDMKKWDI